VKGILSCALAIAALGTMQARSAQDFHRSTLDQSATSAARGFAVQLDNDLFSGAHRDQDYSWGAAFTRNSHPRSGVLGSVERIRERLERALIDDPEQQRSWQPPAHATQHGIIAMTPSTLRSSEPQYGDRPYASLVFATTSQISVGDDGRHARFSSLTIGALGLNAAEWLHRTIHGVVGDEAPLGWEHQIAEGGEPTVRYVQAKQWVLGNTSSRHSTAPEFKLTVSGSVGYLTEGSIALSGRWGRLQSPWWSFAPELRDYVSAPLAPVTRHSSASPAGMFAFAGLRLKARAYNSLLQGQFRHSDVRVPSGDLARLQVESWIGVASTLYDMRVTYQINYTSTEITREPGRRGLIWAGITFERAS
jgi:hypothetical protein